MSVTKNHLIFDLLLTVRGGAISNSEQISENQVGFWIDNTRVKLIRQDIDKRHSINPDLVQSLGCVEVELTDGSECGCKTTGCSIVKTKLQIPKAIETYYRNLITRVGPVQSTAIAYSFIPYEQAIWSGNNPYTSKIPKAFLHNGFMYVVGKRQQIKYLKYINIQGIFESPEDVSSFQTCDGDSCFTVDSKYPISAAMIEDLKRMILEANFRIAATAPTDHSGDSKHDVQQNIEK